MSIQRNWRWTNIVKARMILFRVIRLSVTVSKQFTLFLQFTLKSRTIVIINVTDLLTLLKTSSKNNPLHYYFGISIDVDVISVQENYL